MSGAVGCGWVQSVVFGVGSLGFVVVSESSLGSLEFVEFGEVSPACAGALLAQALLAQDVVVVAIVAGEVGAAWRRGAGSAGGGCSGLGGWRAGGARACVEASGHGLRLAAGGRRARRVCLSVGSADASGGGEQRWWRRARRAVDAVGRLGGRSVEVRGHATHRHSARTLLLYMQ